MNALIAALVSLLAGLSDAGMVRYTIFNRQRVAPQPRSGATDGYYLFLLEGEGKGGFRGNTRQDNLLEADVVFEFASLMSGAATYAGAAFDAFWNVVRATGEFTSAPHTWRVDYDYQIAPYTTGKPAWDPEVAYHVQRYTVHVRLKA